MLFKQNMTKQEFLTRQLERELKRSSRGKMPKEIRKKLALRTIKRLEMNNNNYQMHKSIEGYADILVSNYFAKE